MGVVHVVGKNYVPIIELPRLNINFFPIVVRTTQHLIVVVLDKDKQHLIVIVLDKDKNLNTKIWLEI